MKYKIICRNCKTEFKTNNKKNRYCSQECKENFRLMKETFKCDNCGKEMVKNAKNYRKDSKHHFCSYDCHIKFRKLQEGIFDNCKMCGKEVYRTFKKVREGIGILCSRECSSKWKSENLKGKNNKLHNRIIIQCDYCGKDKEVVPSDLQKYSTHFCSSECMGKYRRNPNKSEDEIYNARKTQQHKDWTNSIFKRDNYTCIISGQVGGKLNAHHLNGYHWDEENRFNVDNGVTLSEELHKEFHSIYGCKNNTREQFEEFYFNKTSKKLKLE